ncbi:MoaD/ThiS family protein [Novosphingobium mangrovi (ex Huang et al. 2023)]|uniref:MoaD/ThiS family protein n=1 Tax=Novosphingobium mangrovi (ex Huang et al. 2023) TaxID=2976432 RepID=A0ABT2I0F0_9SPHN|nr:MoaD/ThiS family protein [Novosphingobium mangrovi (ex Huang et al. 2023)]MCT2398279.1 MoaD/ThiS family protein [Novosphingobium mangrovi (ex Huang et al. 2023)]
MGTGMDLPSSERESASRITLVFLGRLEDLAGGGSRAVAAASSIDAVIDALEPQLARALREPRVKLAVNGILLQDNDAPVLRHGDEIAFLPPVSGG